MLDLKNPFDRLQPLISDHQLLLVGVGTIFYWLIWGYYTGQSRKLNHIPSMGPEVPLFSYIGALNYLLDSKKVINSGVKKWPSAMFKIPEMMYWLVVATEPRVIKEILTAPEDVLSLIDSLEDSLQAKYTLGEHINKDHISIIRTHLTRAIPQLVPEIHEEIIDSFNEFVPVTGEWVAVKALDTFMDIVSRTSSRVFVGRSLCRNPAFRALNVRFTTNVIRTGLLLRLVPHFLRPLMNKLFSNIPKQTRDFLNHMAPLLDARRKEREEKGDKYDKPVDLVTWLMDEAEGKETTDWYFTLRIMTANFVAIHTSSMTFTHAFYYLAAFPDYIKPLREEVEEIVKREGWTKTGIDQMHKIDSFIKESQRLHPLVILLIQRIARGDYTFAEGTTIPHGTTVAIPIRNVHINENIYPDALNFDPLRFVGLKEQETTGRRFDMVTTSVDSLAFGHGRHACPGRYFAACELKLMFAHMITNYDVKLEKGGVRPEDAWFVSYCVPNPNAKVFFRRRVV